MVRNFGIITTAALAALPLACGRSEKACNLEDNSGCPIEQVCERVQGSAPACFAPVNVEGRVFDLANNASVEGAHVVALDPNGAAVSGVAISDAEGVYSLRIPSERMPDGSLVNSSCTLRADAQAYQSFPGGIRPALPVDLTMTTGTDSATVVRNPTTDIGLIALLAGVRGAISGRVEANAGDKAGVLIVGGGSTAISDVDGSFVLFNVTPGTVTVNGYAGGVQLDSATADVVDGMTTENVVLTTLNEPLSMVSGNVNIVNAPGGSQTSVVLVVEDTFNAALERGEVPRGLRAANVSGGFTIEGVPNGRYTVLAAFENDGLVRDPDPGIAGTQIVHITVPMNGSRTVALPASFKVTEALAVRRPGQNAPEGVSGNPTFVWADDSSEDGYSIVVYDAFGNKMWENTTLPAVTGSSDVSATYETTQSSSLSTSALPLQNGMYYQFRATSWRYQRQGTVSAPISRTEDLRGVFFMQ
jgi:hypothetical protein